MSIGEKMTQYKGDKPKVYELAREMGIKSQELLDILQRAGLDYNGFSATIKEPVNQIKEIIEEGINAAEEAEEQKARERGVNLVGMFYNPEDRKYYVADIKLSQTKFEALGGNFDKGYSTVFIAKPKLGAKLEERGLFKPSKYAKEKK